MTELQFDGRVYIVTGSGQGIGAEYALALAHRGARVVVNDIGTGLLGDGSSQGPAREMVARIEEAGGTALANTDSVATVEGCQAVVGASIAAYGRLDGVIHNASIHPPSAPVADFVDDDLERTLGVHLYGAFYLTRAAWPHLARVGGRLLYITSAVGLWGHRSIAPYAAAKTGVVGLARVVAHDGEDRGVRANVLSVGAATRASVRSLDDAPAAREWWSQYLAPNFVAAAGTWLVHPDCPANGRIFNAFGGRMSEIVFAETEGHTQLSWTAEQYRDQFDAIMRRDHLHAMDRSSEWQSLGLDSLLGAGAHQLDVDEGLPEFLRVIVKPEARA
ncbi:MAG: SDR family NAD(P)-dependent oxidoreductase [Actinomycetota bacterium]|nr:SDR family NAD(P)-dependent oxidoreductase [Actinomycetota bacterium]